MKLLIDMNLSPTWVRFLIEAGFEAIHWSEIDAGDAPDQDLLRWAADHQYVLLTNDLDFGATLTATQSRRPSAVLAAIRRAHQDILDGALLSIDPTRFRVRILPLDSPQGS
jgi:predicted nuclease of predicted toxin-antitoxin system